mgnify:CR=1 FL=1
MPRLAGARGWEALEPGPDPGLASSGPRPVRPAAGAQPGAVPRGDRQADGRRGAEPQLAESDRLRRSRTPPGVQRGAEKGTEVELAEAVDVISEERGKVLERVNAAVADGNRRRELALIERAVEGARTPGGHGALGLIDVQRSPERGSRRAPALRRRHRTSGIGRVLEDEIVERALRTSASDHTGRGRGGRALREHGGVAGRAALLELSRRCASGPGPAVNRRVLHDRLLEQAPRGPGRRCRWR